MIENKAPQVYVDFHNIGVDGTFLLNGILDSLPDNNSLPKYVSVTVAFVDVIRVKSVFCTCLTIMINGDSYSYRLNHGFERYYQAKRRIILGACGEIERQEAFDLMQKAFEMIVRKRMDVIMRDIFDAYKN